MATNINNRLVCNEPHANLDSYYGPYNTVHAAYTALADTTVNGITYTKKYIGLTVGVWKDSSHTEITEYWFKGGLSESNLVEKTSDAGLPGGVKIVTFDKNGATGGVQNSVITDTDGKLMLPECTLTKSGTTFSKWSYNGTQKNPGEVITVGTSTVVQAIWASSPTPTTYTVSWSAGTHITSITGKYNEVNTITSGRTQIPAGSTVVLTANVESGCQFSQWTGVPSGATTSGNVLRIQSLSGNVSGISAIGEQVAQEFMLSFKPEGEGVEGVKGLVDGKETSSGSVHPENSSVELTATLTEGYSPVWEGLPDYAVLQDDNKTASFPLKEPLDIIVKANEGPGPVEDGFNYCLLTYEGNRRGGDSADAGDGKNMKWFELEELIKSGGSTEEITENNSNYLYVIRNINSNPIISLADGEKTYSFIPLNECEDPEIITYFTEQQPWVESGTNQTKGALKDYGNYIFIYIDTNSELKGQNIIISIGG